MVFIIIIINVLFGVEPNRFPSFQAVMAKLPPALEFDFFCSQVHSASSPSTALIQWQILPPDKHKELS